MKTADKAEVVLEVRGLEKSYNGVQAVDGVSFTVSRGRCFGLLGPNGAGKTTTVEIMEGIRKPTGGSILYRGLPLSRRFRDEMGIQFQTTAVPDYLTVREILELFSKFYSKTVPIEEVSETCSLGTFLDRDSRKLSGGQRQRMLLAVALVNDPEILFLDEPTTGLDPQSRRNFWHIVDAIKARRKTIILTTHYMEEAYILCDDIVIMDQGRIIAEGPPKRLLEKHYKGMLISLPEDVFKSAGDNLPWPYYRQGGRVEIHSTDVSETLAHLTSRGVDLSRVEIRSQTLEDLFLDLTGRQLRG